MTPNEADDHELWQLAAVLGIDYAQDEAAERIARKRERDAGTMAKRAAAIQAAQADRGKPKRLQTATKD
jgi:hypothetical protein